MGLLELSENRRSKIHCDNDDLVSGAVSSGAAASWPRVGHELAASRPARLGGAIGSASTDDGESIGLPVLEFFVVDCPKF